MLLKSFTSKKGISFQTINRDFLDLYPCDSSLQTQETREILHFHYTTWPDFGVPESPASFLNFLFKVRESRCLNSDHGPVVVHCSAGIGRSGTFCLVDTCLLLVSTEFSCSDSKLCWFVKTSDRLCSRC